MSNWEDFYASNRAPEHFEDIQIKLRDFCKHNENERIVLVTSGGTTVPMEYNTVRFVDNFSAGTRGASSTEYFLTAGYAVIFLYRLKSVEPFVRHFTGRQFLDTLTIIEDDPANKKIQVKETFTPHMLPLLRGYQAAVSSARLLYVDFTSLSDYMWLLREACKHLAPLGPRAMLFLAAAVSDFYIPPDEIPEHKMQSAEGAPVISLQLVPKMLAPLVSLWVPQAFVVSFKLETDPQILISKAQGALHNYKHKVVVGNLLHSRRYHVIVVEPDSHYDIKLTDEELKSGVEIEENIVEDLAKRHSRMLE